MSKKNYLPCYSLSLYKKLHWSTFKTVHCRAKNYGQGGKRIINTSISSNHDGQNYIYSYTSVIFIILPEKFSKNKGGRQLPLKGISKQIMESKRVKNYEDNSIKDG